MTNEEIVAKIREDGCDNMADLMQELYQQNRGLIYRMAVKWCKGSETIDDLMQEGFLALANAVNTYHADQGAFVTWLGVHLKSQFNAVTCDRANVVRLPRCRVDQVRLYRREYGRYYRMHGEHPSARTMAGIMGVGLDEAEKIAALVRNEEVASLDVPIGAEGTGLEALTLLDTIQDPHDDIGAAEDDLCADELSAEIWSVVDTLGPEMASVIHAHYQDGQSFTAIGERMGVTRQRADQYEKRGLRILRKCRQRNKLLDCLDIYSAGLHGTGVTRFRETGTSATERAALKQCMT